MKHNHKNITPRRANERGNVFFFILVGVIMFATLSFVVARGFRSDTTNTLTKRQLELAVTDILSYSASIEHAISRLRRNGVSESDISFHDAEWGHTDYEHAAPQPDENKVFSGAGGRIGYRIPEGLPNMDFRDDFMIEGIASNANPELTLISTNLTEDLCTKINSKVGISGIPAIATLAATTGEAVGDFTARAVKNTIGDTTAALENQPIACIESVAGSGNFNFYYVLLAR